MAKTWSLFVYVRPFLNTVDKYNSKSDYKSEDGVLGIWTRDCRIVGSDKSTETWHLPSYLHVSFDSMSIKFL